MTPGTSSPWTDVLAVSAVTAAVVLAVVGLLALVDRQGARVPVAVARGMGVVAATWASLGLGYWLEGQTWFLGGPFGARVWSTASTASSSRPPPTTWSGSGCWWCSAPSAGLLLVRHGVRGRASTHGWHRRWLREGLLVWFVTLPVQVTLLAAGVISWLTWAGIAVVAAGAVLAWLERPVGLALLGWGTWLVSADAWPGVLTVLSPVLVTWWLLGRPRAGAATVRRPVGDS